MKLSRAAGYGIHAVVFIAKEEEKGQVLARTIAKRYKLPLESLLKVLQQLVRSQILSSTRGPSGGFRMGRAAEKVSLADIITAADGPIVGQSGFNGSVGEARIKRAITKLCKESAKQVHSTFDSVKVADLL